MGKGQVGKPKEIKDPVLVSSKIEKSDRKRLRELSNTCDISLREVILQGLNVFVSENESAFKYRLRKIEGDLNDLLHERKIFIADLEREKDLRLKKLDTKIGELKNEMDAIKDYHVDKSKRLKAGLKEVWVEIRKDMTVKQKHWKGNLETVDKFKRLYQIVISFDQLYELYDDLDAECDIIKGDNFESRRKYHLPDVDPVHRKKGKA